MNDTLRPGNYQRNTVLVGLVLSIFFLWMALRNVIFQDLKSAFHQANLLLALPILIILGAYYWLKAIRWSQLLAPAKKLSARMLAPSMMIGLAANNLLPAHLGELVRTYLLARKQQIAVSTVLATLVSERVFDIVSILLLVAIATANTELSEEFAAAGLFLIAVATVIVISMALLVAARGAFVRAVTICLRPFPARFTAKVVQQLEMAAAGFESLKSWSVYPSLALNSLLQWLFMASAILLSMKAFNVPAPPESAILVLGLIVAGITLPSAPGFFGTVEFCFVLGLSAYGVDASVALSTAIFYHTITWGAATATGFGYLRFYGLRLSDIRSPSRG